MAYKSHLFPSKRDLHHPPAPELGLLWRGGHLGTAAAHQAERRCSSAPLITRNHQKPPENPGRFFPRFSLADWQEKHRKAPLRSLLSFCLGVLVTYCRSFFQIQWQRTGDGGCLTHFREVCRSFPFGHLQMAHAFETKPINSYDFSHIMTTGHAQVMKIRRPVQRMRNIICGSRLGKGLSFWHRFRNLFSSAVQVGTGGTASFFDFSFCTFILIRTFWNHAMPCPLEMVTLTRAFSGGRSSHPTRSSWKARCEVAMEGSWIGDCNHCSTRWYLFLSICRPLSLEKCRRNFRVGYLR